MIVPSTRKIFNINAKPQHYKRYNWGYTLKFINLKRKLREKFTWFDMHT